MILTLLPLGTSTPAAGAMRSTISVESSAPEAGSRVSPTASNATAASPTDMQRKIGTAVSATPDGEVEALGDGSDRVAFLPEGEQRGCVEIGAIFWVHRTRLR